MPAIQAARRKRQLLLQALRSTETELETEPCSVPLPVPVLPRPRVERIEMMQSDVAHEFARACRIPEGLRITIAHDASPPLDVNVECGYALIGRDPRCHVQVIADDISPVHAFALVLRGKLLVCDLGSESGTWSGPDRIERTVLASDAPFRCGSALLRIESRVDETEGHSRVRESDRAPARILFPRRSGEEVEYCLKNSVSIIGADPRCTAHLANRTVSPFHCAFVRIDHEVWLIDLGSEHGTFVDDERIAIARIADGSELTLGRVAARLSLEEGNLQRSQVPARRRPQPGMSEEFVRDLLSEFRAAQRETLAEMKSCLVEVVKVMAANNAAAQAGANSAAAGALLTEALERVMKPALPGAATPFEPIRRRLQEPGQVGLPATAPGDAAPAAAEFSEAEERLDPEDLRHRIQDVDERLRQQGTFAAVRKVFGGMLRD